MMWRVLLSVLSLLVFSCDGALSPTEIAKRVLENYNKNEAPKTHTEVKLGMYVYNIQYLGDETSDFLLGLYLRQSWKDPRLSFSAIDGETKQVRFPDERWRDIWLPDTFIRWAKSVQIVDDLSSSRLLKVNATGSVWYVTKVSAVIPSRFNLRNYPFDRQQLNLSFESFGHTMDTLDFSTLSDNPVEMAPDMAVSQFDVKESLINDCSMNYTTGAYPCLEVRFVLERRSHQFVVQFFLPSILIVILSWFSFWIDPETSSPSRLLTGFLSLLALILLDTVGGTSKMAAMQHGTILNCWMMVCYLLVFGTLLEYAVVNILSKKPRGARGFEYLKPPFVGTEKTIEANEKQVDGSGGDVRRKARLVDWFARICFPIAFILFNLIFWIKVIA